MCNDINDTPLIEILGTMNIIDWSRAGERKD